MDLHFCSNARGGGTRNRSAATQPAGQHRTQGCVQPPAATKRVRAVTRMRMPFAEEQGAIRRRVVPCRRLVCFVRGRLASPRLARRRAPCHDLGLRPCKGEQLGLRA